MGRHKFNPNNKNKLDSPERKKLLPPYEILDKFVIKKGWHAADIGCGTGYFTIPLASYVGKDGMVYAVDIEDEMIETVKKKVKINGLRNIKCIKSEENSIPLDDESLDAAVMIFVFHELKQPSIFLKELKRVIKPGGRVYIADWQKKPTKYGPPVEHRVTEDEVIKLLGDHNMAAEQPLFLFDVLYGINAVRR